MILRKQIPVIYPPAQEVSYHIRIAPLVIPVIEYNVFTTLEIQIQYNCKYKKRNDKNLCSLL